MAVPSPVSQQPGQPPDSAEVVVVGAGVIGLSAAAFLARDGHEVVVLDRAEVPGSDASTHNAGQLRPAACIPLAARGAIREFARSTLKAGRPLRLNRGALRQWRWPLAFATWTRSPDLPRRTRVLAELGHASEDAYRTLEGWLGRELIVRRGALDVYESEHAWRQSRDVTAVLEERGFAVESLSGADAAEREPVLGGRPAGALWFPDAGHCDPVAVCAALAEVAGAAGATFFPRTTVQRIEQQGDHELVHAGERQLRASTVVLAAGSRSRDILSPVAAQALPVIAGRGYGIDLPDGLALERPLIFVERHVSVTPWPGGGLRLTSGMDVGASGARVAEHRLRALRHAGHATLRGLREDEHGRSWTAIRPMSPDGLPLVGQLPRRERILAASGHGMLGVTYGPATGRLVAELLSGAPPAWSEALAPSRFASGWSARNVARASVTND